MHVDVTPFIMHGGWAGRSRSLKELQCGSWVTELWALCWTNPSLTFPISLSPVLLAIFLSFSPYRCSEKQVKPLQLSALATIYSTAQSTARTCTSRAVPPPSRPTLSNRYPSRPFPLLRPCPPPRSPKQLRRPPARRSPPRKTRSKTHMEALSELQKYVPGIWASLLTKRVHRFGQRIKRLRFNVYVCEVFICLF